MQKHCLCFAQAILGGLFFVLAFPPVGWWWVLPLGLALLIDAMGTDEFSKRTIFALGVLVYGVLFCWVRYVTLLGWVGLSLFSALLWLGVFVVWRKTRSPLISAGVWVLFEQLREALGWGWLPVASALEGAPHPRMVAAIGGEVLLGFLIVWLGFAIALIAQNRRPLQSRWLYIASAVVLLWWGAGTTLSNAPLRNSGSLNLGFVQPAAKTKLDKSESEIAKDLRELQALTHDVALEGRANLILWPEQVTPWAVNDDFSMRAWVEAGAAAIGRPILFGGLWHRDGNYYNAMSFVTPKGGLAQEFYAKRRLVPFGEYVPFADLGWTRSLTPVVDSFAAGDSEWVLNVAGRKFFPLICYEDTFSGLADGAREGADAIVVATNDGWFGHEGAQSQHVAHDVLRAIEQGIPAVRVANDGLSGIVSPKGKFEPIDNGSFGAVAEVRLLNCDRAWSGFAQHPDLWRWSFPVAMIFLGALGRAIRQPRKPKN